MWACKTGLLWMRKKGERFEKKFGCDVTWELFCVSVILCFVTWQNAWNYRLEFLEVRKEFFLKRCHSCVLVTMRNYTWTVVKIDFTQVLKGFKSKKNLQWMRDFMNVFCLHFASEQLFNLKLLTEPDLLGSLAGPRLYSQLSGGAERELRTEVSDKNTPVMWPLYARCPLIVLGTPTYLASHWSPPPLTGLWLVKRSPISPP